MLVKRALVLLLVVSFIAAGLPSQARAAEPKNTAGAEAFANSLLRDPEVQQLLQAVLDGISPATKEMLEQVAQLAVSGASVEDVGEQLGIIVNSLPETTQADIEQLVFRLFYVGGVGFMAEAIAKFKQHKDNPTQNPIQGPIALFFIAAALLIIPSIFTSGGATLFPDCSPNCHPAP